MYGEKSGKKRRPHDELVEEVLPGMAEDLQREGMISAFTRHPSFKIPIGTISNQKFAMPIHSDGQFTLPDGTKIVVEVVNPIDPKRLLGEYFYAAILRDYHPEVAGTLMLIMVSSGKHENRYAQRQLLFGKFSGFLSSRPRIYAAGWMGNYEERYRTLKQTLQHIKVLCRIKEGI